VHHWLTITAIPKEPIFMGQSPPGSTYNSDGNGLPFFQGKTDFGDIFPTVRMYCTEPKRIAEVNDILISVRAPVGPTNLAPIKSAIGRGLAAIRCKENTDVKYLLYFLRYNEPRLAQLGKGSTFEAIGRDELEDIRVPLPPLPEQQRIAAILDRADRLRRTRRYAAQLSETFLQAVFVRMFGEYVTADTDTRFQDVLAMPLQNGFFETNDKYGNGTPVVWVDNLYHTISIDTTNLRRVQTDEATIRKYEVLEGDLLFTRSSLVREGVGQINLVPAIKDRTLFESHIIRARVDQTKVNPFYVLELYRSNFGRAFVMKGAHTATMTTVQQDTINVLPCPLPPLAVQEKFARIVQQFERLRAQQREAERQAEHLFQTLLHRAFGG
jgi:type I restriction enzyme S subunit